MEYDVAVIGAGVVGSLVARELSRYRLKVCLLEKEEDVAMGATKANSAIVHGGFDPVPGTLKARLNVKGTAMMPSLARELHVPYQNNGSLVVAFSKEEMEHVKLLYRRGLDNGVPGMKLLSGQEVKEMEPHLSSKTVGALLCGSAGIVCPYELTIAAAGNAMDNGVELKTGFAVTEIEEKDGVFTLSDGKEAVRCRYAVNCAGLFADDIAHLAGEKDIALIPKRGEYLLLDKNEGGLVSHTIFQVPTAAGKGVLVTPTVDGNLLTGPTSHVVASKEDKDTTREGLEEIRRAAAKSVEDIPFRQVIHSFAGLRASIKGEDFIIHPSARWPRLIHTLGIDSPGLSSAPAIALEVVGLLEKAGLALEENPGFRGERPSPHAFREMSMEEKNRVIARDSRFGHIVCRCESVTEGEIVAAIHQNPPAKTMDAVKRRTRAGMGRCQSGFCTAYVAEILARELGVAEEEITKSGGNSRLLTGRAKAGPAGGTEETGGTIQ